MSEPLQEYVHSGNHELRVDRTSGAVSADDKKFIVANPVAENTSVPITVVLNWTADLKK